MEARAFCPGHITTFFVPRGGPSTPAVRRGSTGSGFSTEEGVTAAVAASGGGASSSARGRTWKFKVADNGAPPRDVRLTALVLRGLEAAAPRGWHRPARIEIENRYRLPLGAGFGVSGALALSLALAANDAMEVGLSRAQCVRAAHAAEVGMLTGLGDVAAQSVGGFEVRVRPGPPPFGEVRTPKAASAEVVLASFGPRPTRAFLRDPRGKRALRRAGTACLKELLRAPSLAESARLGRRFAEELGLASPAARGLLAEFGPRNPASVAMLGDSVFVLGGAAAEANVRARAGRAFVLRTRVSPTGARLL